MFNQHPKKHGFTLLEILLVIAAIAILAGIVILALNPGKQLADTRNSQRRSDVNTILNGVYQFTIDNNGTLPTTAFTASTTIQITTSLKQICRTGTATSSCESGSLVMLTELTDSEKFLVSIPVDPNATTTNGAGYYIKKSANGRITVQALAAEQNATISVTR